MTSLVSMQSFGYLGPSPRRAFYSRHQQNLWFGVIWVSPAGSCHQFSYPMRQAFQWKIPSGGIRVLWNDSGVCMLPEVVQSKYLHPHAWWCQRCWPCKCEEGRLGEATKHEGLQRQAPLLVPQESLLHATGAEGQGMECSRSSLPQTHAILSRLLFATHERTAVKVSSQSHLCWD